ncbi:hypothetical protein [Methanobrevibacter sp.]|uniref:hypothetical protein n=1 Tax=Methanobrevibacter sp. TaxID=66852 RepID=UPI0038696375
MENVSKSSNNTKNNELVTLTAHEIANALGENYKSVQKMLNALATSGEIEVTEKTVNNRVLKGYIVSIEDIQKIKTRFTPKKHLLQMENDTKIQMLTNAQNKLLKEENKEEFTNDTNVKIYEVMTKNSELEKENEKLKKDLQEKINSNTRLDADLTIAKSELKFIEDKQKTFENAYSEQKLENEKLQKVIKNRNLALLLLGAVFLVFLTITLTVIFITKTV